MIEIPCAVAPTPATLVAAGRLLHQQDDFAGAARLYDMALTQDPENSDALYLAGMLALRIGETEGAVKVLGKACKVNPCHGPSRYLLGHVLSKLGQREAALGHLDLAVELMPDQVLPWCKHAEVLISLERYAQAVESCERALSIDSQHSEARCNRAAIHFFLHEMDEAAQILEKVVDLAPEDRMARRSLGWCYMYMGQWDRGSAMCGEFQNFKRDYPQPLWTGRESLEGKTILLYSNEGFGDVIQFFRYVALVRERGAHVVLDVPPALAGLLTKGQMPAVELADGPPGRFDYHCPVLDLPWVFNTMPGTVPFPHAYLQADAAKVQRWRDRLGPSGKLRVGLAWSGNPLHINDSHRSLLLAQLTCLLDDDEIQFVCLQKDVRDVDRPALQALPQLLFPGDEINDFSDTAALCELMDLVVAADINVAHVAGAIGKPLWIMLPFHGDPRWLLDRTDTPWYACARLFRQARRRDWSNVLDEVRAGLQALKRARNAAETSH